jgi:hypothetical protein
VGGDGGEHPHEDHDPAVVQSAFAHGLLPAGVFSTLESLALPFPFLLGLCSLLLLFPFSTAPVSQKHAAGQEPGYRAPVIVEPRDLVAELQAYDNPQPGHDQDEQERFHSSEKKGSIVHPSPGGRFDGHL